MSKTQADSLQVFKNIFGNEAEGFLVGLKNIPNVLKTFLVILLIPHLVYLFYFFFSFGTLLLFFLDFLFFVSHRNVLALYGQRQGFYLVNPEGKMVLIAGNPDWAKKLTRSSTSLILRISMFIALYLSPLFLSLIFLSIPTVPDSISVALLLFGSCVIIYPIAMFFYNVTKIQNNYADKGIVLVNDSLDALVAFYVEKNNLSHSSVFDLSKLFEFTRNPEYQQAQGCLENLKDFSQAAVNVNTASKLIK